MSHSEISEFYTNQTVLITGGTGFLGKVLIERLLRTTNLQQIFVLIRPKKGKAVQTRLEDLLNNPLYTRLKKENPSFTTRISALEGDCVSDNLGLNLQDKLKVISDVNIVFHVAATVHMNENIKSALKINVGGTENVLQLCQQMKCLKAVIHVSTAFSNCHLDTIDEVFYNYPLSYEKIKFLLQDLTPSEAHKQFQKFLTGWPNTYAFTKALTESLVASAGKTLPIGVFRPAIVTSTYIEPIENWSDSFGGPNSVLAGAALGFIRLFPCNSRTCIETVPVDLTIAALVASAWDVHNDKTQVKIYNYVSSIDNPITHYEFSHLITLQFCDYPLKKAKWTPRLYLIKKSVYYHMLKFLYHNFPAIILDFFQVIRFKKPEMLAKIRKANEVLDLLSFYTDREWKFSNRNVKLLWKKMNEADRKLYNFDITTVQWTKYLRNYHKGLRVYLLKDDLGSLPEAKAKLKRFQVLHSLLNFGIYWTKLSLIWLILSKLFACRKFFFKFLN